ncbi:hypothetical protein LTR62_005529 [Meristemomyces frigidus]|uniref:Uncharacterized protein n=1 Tax=Meristemomyces frigidus TaxID=1508187 RepID=A0AAN7TPJ0_9PEZI|nr:hypothetical protein LTR62_005529 [Meristemomyces frigidus]
MQEHSNEHDPVPNPDSFLDRVIEINGYHYERSQAITDYRRDPGEARVLYLCRRAADDEPWKPDAKEQTFIMKVKVQVPPRPASNDATEPLPGPSDTTADERKALQKFRESSLNGVPHLVASKCVAQAATGPFPGGYVSYTIMTLMPGQDLMETKFWSLDDGTKAIIRDAFVNLLKNIWRLDIAPYDCALRNIIWDPETRRCSIVDFEHYESAKDPVNMHENEEMQRWGIVQRPASSHWAVEWGLLKESNVVASAM